MDEVAELPLATQVRLLRVLEVGEFIHTLGDFHIYKEHFNQVETQLKREPKKLPSLQFAQKDINNYSIDDFKLVNYDYHPSISAEMNV